MQPPCCAIHAGLSPTPLSADTSFSGTEAPCALSRAQLDAREVSRGLLRLYFGLVLALNEACVLRVGGRRLLLRVTAADTLDAAAREEAVGYHCFRGEPTLGCVSSPGLASLPRGS